MDKKEMLYEISLKYNTLKMYENTIDQMKKNGNTGETLTNIIAEKNNVEKELVELLDPKLPEPNPINNCANDPSISEEKLNGNKFIQAQKKRAEYKSLYDIRKNFFDDITKNEIGWAEYVPETPAPTLKEVKERIEKEIKDKKPKFADIQEKISNSQWISRSNFIVNFPKDKIDIDAWRVSGFHYTLKQKSSCGSFCNNNYGDMYIIVNDFAEKKEDGTYNILSKIIKNLYMYKVNVIGSIDVDVIDNNGEVLYKLRFTNCIFNDAEPDSFSYDSTDLRRISLHFSYDDVKIASPDEKFV